MTVHAKTAPRPQDPRDLGDRPIDVGDVLEHAVGDDGRERGVRKRHPARVRSDEQAVDAARPGLGQVRDSRVQAHVRALGKKDRSEVPVPAADVEDRAWKVDLRQDPRLDRPHEHAVETASRAGEPAESAGSRRAASPLRPQDRPVRSLRRTRRCARAGTARGSPPGGAGSARATRARGGWPSPARPRRRSERSRPFPSGGPAGARPAGPRRRRARRGAWPRPGRDRRTRSS